MNKYHEIYFGELQKEAGTGREVDHPSYGAAVLSSVTNPSSSLASSHPTPGIQDAAMNGLAEKQNALLSRGLIKKNPNEFGTVSANPVAQAATHAPPLVGEPLPQTFAQR